jgi:hypothetical protein
MTLAIVDHQPRELLAKVSLLWVRRSGHYSLTFDSSR